MPPAGRGLCVRVWIFAWNLFSVVTEDGYVWTGGGPAHGHQEAPAVSVKCHRNAAGTASVLTAYLWCRPPSQQVWHQREPISVLAAATVPQVRP